MSNRINPRMRAIAAEIGAADCEYRVSQARGISSAIARQNRASYQDECEERAARVSPFTRRALAGQLPAADYTSRIGGRS